MIDLEDRGPNVSVHVDRRLPLRLGILVSGAVLATGLLMESVPSTSLDADVH